MDYYEKSFLNTNTGISGRLFAHWMDLSDMNLVNDLVEKGFVQMKTGRIITLHPMI